MKINWPEISILVVDDDPDLRETICDVFSRMGAKTIAAVNGVDALNNLNQSPVSLIISDLQMPEMDGTVLLQKVREKQLKVPFIFITGQTHFSEAKAIELGAEGLIYKPYTFRTLTEKIQNILNHSRSLPAL